MPLVSLRYVNLEVLRAELPGGQFQPVQGAANTARTSSTTMLGKDGKGLVLHDQLV